MLEDILYFLYNDRKFYSKLTYTVYVKEIVTAFVINLAHYLNPPSSLSSPLKSLFFTPPQELRLSLNNALEFLIRGEYLFKNESETIKKILALRNELIHNGHEYLFEGTIDLITLTVVEDTIKTVNTIFNRLPLTLGKNIKDEFYLNVIPTISILQSLLKNPNMIDGKRYYCGALIILSYVILKEYMIFIFLDFFPEYKTLPHLKNIERSKLYGLAKKFLLPLRKIDENKIMGINVLDLEDQDLLKKLRFIRNDMAHDLFSNSFIIISLEDHKGYLLTILSLIRKITRNYFLLAGRFTTIEEYTDEEIEEICSPLETTLTMLWERTFSF